MKCQNCGKNEATVRYKESINGKKQELYLCSECASKVGIIDFPIVFSPMFTSINDNYLNEYKVTKCKNCGYTLEDYSKTGLFGCPDCYNTFENELDTLFLKFHGKNRHIKINNKNLTLKKVVSSPKSADEKIVKLKEKLKQLIENEKYEEAAIIRDKIKKIEGK